MAGTWIQTLTNKKLEPLALTPEMVGPIDEIAHALAGKFRFTCQTNLRLSVAEHCVRGSRLLPPAFAGAFLLHELSEVYLPDIAAPIKPSLRVTAPGCTEATISWVELEKQHTSVILESLGLSSLEPLIYSHEVRHMDLAMLVAEKRDLCGPEPESWGLPDLVANTGPIMPWDPNRAELEFLSRFHELFSLGR